MWCRRFTPMHGTLKWPEHSSSVICQSDLNLQLVSAAATQPKSLQAARTGLLYNSAINQEEQGHTRCKCRSNRVSLWSETPCPYCIESQQQLLSFPLGETAILLSLIVFCSEAWHQMLDSPQGLVWWRSEH